MRSLREVIVSLVAAVIGGGLLCAMVGLSLTNPVLFSHIAAYVRFGVSCVIFAVCLAILLGQLFDS